MVRCSGKEFWCSVVLCNDLSKRIKFKDETSNISLILTSISACCCQSYSLTSHKLFLFLRWTTQPLPYNFEKEKLYSACIMYIFSTKFHDLLRTVYWLNHHWLNMRPGHKTSQRSNKNSWPVVSVTDFASKFSIFCFFHQNLFS